jgi:8-oxo-dGTP pyrophosphatase MutT (NUDIX family)
MKQLAVLNPENSTPEEIQKFRVRESARAVILDENNLVALLYVSKNKYYKLPGGGLEGVEDRIEALRRECLEEAGCEVEVIGEVGSILEYRKVYNLKQTSYCYFAKVAGPKGNPNFTELELSEGFELTWMTYPEALTALGQSRATTVEGKSYIIPRDLIFLQTAKDYLN